MNARAVLALWLAVALASVTWGVAAPAAADDIADFEDARSAYDTGNYPVAVERFEALVGGDVPRLTNAALVLESRKYLAASLLFVSRESDAERQFELLLRQDPDYQIDPVQFPTAVVDLFNRVRRRLERDLRRLRQQRDAEARAAQERARRRAADARHREALLLRLATTETEIEHRSRWLALVPIFGQLQNGDVGLAVVLAAIDGVLLVTNVVSFIIHETLPAREELADADLADAEAAATAARLTNQFSLGMLGLSFVVGILDAQIRFEGTRRIERRRPLPVELRPTASAGPDGGSLGLRLAF